MTTDELIAEAERLIADGHRFQDLADLRSALRKMRREKMKQKQKVM